jgi:DnaK suppressor protein
MNKAEAEQIKQALHRLQAEIEEQEKAFSDAGRTVELDQTRVGRLSRMDAMQAQQMALETARRRQQKLSGIEGALRRIESGDYGYCFVCGDEIVINRLMADPSITRCIKCVESH